jgi:hypothetical protein
MGLLTNLVSYWKFDESSGNASDSNGSNTLTNTNTATFGAGKINNGTSLARVSSQYFTIADASQSGLDITGDMTIQAWVKPATLTAATYYPILTKFAASNVSYLLRFYGDTLRMTTSSDGTAETGNIIASSISTGSFIHIVMVYTASSGSVTAYINGSAQTPVTGFSTSIYNGTGALGVGALGAGADTNFFDGMVDEVGIWNRALTAAEVTQLYNGGAGLAYPLSSGSGFMIMF